MKQLDFDRAFPQTPDCVHAAIEMGFRKGQKQMKMRNKIIGMGSIAAALMIMFAVTLATGGLSIAPEPDVLAQPKVTDVPKPTEQPMVWCTEKGNYYHSEEHCSGMEGAIYGTLSYALALDKTPCPVCITARAELRDYNGAAYITDAYTGEILAAISKPAPAEPDPKAELLAEATVYCTEGGSYYHSYADCSGMLNASAISLSEAVDMGKEACPRCLGPAIVFATPHGNYYHSEKDCSGMEGATAMNPEEALWWDKHPCPVCITGKKVNVASSDMYYHESDTCSAAEFYYDKYPLLDALTIGMTPCPECTAVEVTPEEENQDAFWAEAEADQEKRVYAVYGQARYYHKADICNGQQNNRSLTLANAEKEQLIPCPDCYTTFTTEENAEIAEPVFYCTPSGKYYHLEPDCSGMRNAEARTPEQVFINSGYTACPSCIDTDEEKALLMLPVPQDDTDEVFIAPSNSYYHRDHGCFYMSMVIKADLKSAKDMGHTPCPMCFREQVDLSTFETCWATQNGKYYHSDEHCSGMRNAVSGLVEEARAKGKMRCPICMKTTPENYDLFTTAFGQEIEDLYPGYIYECTNYGFEWNISNGTESFRLCDVHPKGTAFFGEELPGLPELHLTNLPAKHHVFMANAPAPIGSMYAAAPAEMEKALRHSKLTAEELQLQEVVVYFDANRQVRACEMQFGFSDHVKLAWKVGADGRIELTESEFVKPGWDDSSGETTQKAADEAIVTGTPSPVEFKTLSSPTLPDTLYQVAFGNLEKALDLGYGFYSKDSSHLDFSFVPKEENRYTLFGRGQIVLTLDWQENANASPLKYTMNVQLDGTREGGKRFMESVSAQPIASLYPQAVRLAKEHLASTHKKDAESYDPYVVLLLMGFDEAKQLCALQMDFRNDEETFGIEYVPTNDSLSSWKSRIIT